MICHFSAAIMENYILQDIYKTMGNIVKIFASTPRFSGFENIIQTKLRPCDALLLCNHHPQDEKPHIVDFQRTKGHRFKLRIMKLDLKTC